MTLSVFKLLIKRPITNMASMRTVTTSVTQRSDKVPEEALPKNLIQENVVQPKGVVYDLKPFRMKLQANKKYMWCCCGESKSQPLCDGTHKIQTLRIKIEPVPFMVDETKDYWLCNCKQTNHRPFCDGTHKTQKVKDMFTKKVQ